MTGYSFKAPSSTLPVSHCSEFINIMHCMEWKYHFNITIFYSKSIYAWTLRVTSFFPPSTGLSAPYSYISPLNDFSITFLFLLFPPTILSFSKWSERKRGEKWRRVTAGQLVWRNWGWCCHNRSCILIQNSGEEWLDLTHYPNAVIKAWGRFREQSREAVPSVLNTHTHWPTQTDKDTDRARQDRQDANGVRQLKRRVQWTQQGKRNGDTRI